MKSACLRQASQDYKGIVLFCSLLLWPPSGVVTVLAFVYSARKFVSYLNKVARMSKINRKCMIARTTNLN